MTPGQRRLQASWTRAWRRVQRAREPVFVLHVATALLAWSLSGGVFEATPDLFAHGTRPFDPDDVIALAADAAILMARARSAWPYWLGVAAAYVGLGLLGRVWWLLVMTGATPVQALQPALRQQPAQWLLWMLRMTVYGLLGWLTSAILANAWLASLLGQGAPGTYGALIAVALVIALWAGTSMDLAAASVALGAPLTRSLYQAMQTPAGAVACKAGLRLGEAATVAFGLAWSTATWPDGLPVLGIVVHQLLALTAIGLRAQWVALCAGFCETSASASTT